MSEMYEGAVALYLTRPGDVFLSQQYINQWDKDNKEGGSVPDFVALDFSKAREVIIVEVTTAADWKPLAKRVKDRAVNWYRPVIRKLLELRAIDGEWRIRFLGFIRDSNVPTAQADFADQPDVTFTSLEDATHSWMYWDDRHSALPGRGHSIRLPPLVTQS